ncbi:hypothetical protein KAI58_00060 [Candidatus Gracilibacteria bacterium]|nr:hypothetical protein [Candidatus Gracilibacteria bacterium]
MNFLLHALDKALLTPIRACKKRYIPLLFIYFSYGASAFSAIALSFWEKETISLSAQQLIAISVWIMIPWTVKMVFGQMVDSVKIFGSRRKIYILIGAFFMILGSILLAGLAGRYSFFMTLGSEYSLYLLSLLFSTLGFVIQDVTADTMTTEVVETENKTEEEIQSEIAMVQVLGRLALSVAGFAVAGLGGWLAATFSYESIFWSTLIIPIISILGALFVKLEKFEDKLIPPLDYKIFGGGIAFGAFSIFMGINDFPFSQEIVFIVSFILLSTMLFFVARHLPRSQWKVLFGAMAAIFLYRATPSVGPGLNWWTIDILEFDQKFFGVLAQIGAATALAILWLFSSFITKYPLRTVLIFLIFVETIMSLPELGLYFGIHEYLGMNAQTIALFDTALSSPLVHISMVLILSLIAFYAPKGYRGTWFAIGASFTNLALTAGSLFTKYLNKIFIVTREVQNEAGEILSTQNYDNLGSLLITVIIISFFMPLLAVFLFLPKKKKKQPNNIDFPEEVGVPQSVFERRP